MAWIQAFKEIQISFNTLMSFFSALCFTKAAIYIRNKIIGSSYHIFNMFQVLVSLSVQVLQTESVSEKVGVEIDE